jgi:hypothetical protein
MKPLFKIVIFSLCLFSIGEGLAYAQLYWNLKPDKDTFVISQLGDKKIDHVYVYNATDYIDAEHPINDLFTRRGAIKAVSPDSLDGWKFVWSKYDYAQRIFVKTDSGILSGNYFEIKDNLNTGGYQVEMIKVPVDTTFCAWVFINQLRLHLRKTKDRKVSTFYSQCGYANLGIMKVGEPSAVPDSTYIHNDFYYANPGGVGKINRYLKDDTIIKWTPENLDFSEASTQTYLYNPPVVIDTFKIDFRDQYNNHARDSIYYDPIRTIADFDISVFNDAVYDSLLRLDPERVHLAKDSVNSYKEPDTTKDDAPLKARFHNKSKNGYHFEWLLADKYQSYNNILGRQSDHILNSDTSVFANYIYFRPPDSKPAAYIVKLISTGPDNICKDTAIKTVKILNSQVGTVQADNIKSDTMIFPTAFMPDSPNEYNKYFTYKYYGPDENATNRYLTSVRNFHLKIFNQWGRLVYKYDDPIKFNWHGWDGRTMSGGKAPAGVYFYVYEVLGWGPFEQKQVNLAPSEFKKTGKGFVYLLR